MTDENVRCLNHIAGWVVRCPNCLPNEAMNDNKNKIEIPATAPVDPLPYTPPQTARPRMHAITSDGDITYTGEPVLLDATKALRRAALETLLSGALLLTEVRRSTQSQTYGQVLECEKRFTAALESLREALA